MTPLPAPIALFCHKRPLHTLQCLESLAANSLASSSTLYIFCDGPKKPQDQNLVEEVRRVARQRSWCGTVHVVEQLHNLGLARSIIQGVTRIVQEHGSIIVLEDDLQLAPHFLDFMNAGLQRFHQESRVMLVTGYMFPTLVPTDQRSCFLPLCSSWSWATWSRAWQHFDPTMAGYDVLLKDPFLRYRFDVGGTIPYFQMLQQQRSGNLDSWAIRWYLSVFLREGLALFPPCSLVRNLGFDNTGTHCGISHQYDTLPYQGKITRFPENIQVNQGVLEAIKEFFHQVYRRRSPHPVPGWLTLKKWAKRLAG